jgi:hypothetical protein
MKAWKILRVLIVLTDVNEVTEGDLEEVDPVLGLAQGLEIVDVEVEVAQGNGKYIQFIFKY